MKKLLLATLVASISTLAMADTGSVYVQGNVGASKLKIQDDGRYGKAGFGIAVGKDFGATRYALDYTNFGKIKAKGSIGERGRPDYDEWTETLKVQSVGASAFYDYQTNKGFTPYTGVRIGINQLNYQEEGFKTIMSTDGSLKNENYNESKKMTKLGAGITVGAQYALNSQLTLDVATTI